MSPLSRESVKSPSPVVPEAMPVAPAVVQKESVPPITILSELDSYIASRMKEQPPTLEEVASHVELVERMNQTRHRLSLPDYFQKLTYDNEGAPGPYVFHWITKEKRSIDRALNARGWTMVNRTYFPDAPRYLFTANGGVEVGDSILGFMPARQALELRSAPGKRSTERIKAQITNVEADYALMTGNPKDERIYKPDLGNEALETSEASVPGVITEGRDFP